MDYYEDGEKCLSVKEIRRLPMRLKESFITQEIDDTQFLVPVGTVEFNGIVRSNQTAAFIVNCLKKDTTEEIILAAMCDKYDAPRERIAADVRKILQTLRTIGALEE